MSRAYVCTFYLKTVGIYYVIYAKSYLMFRMMLKTVGQFQIIPLVVEFNLKFSLPQEVKIHYYLPLINTSEGP